MASKLMLNPKLKVAVWQEMKGYSDREFYSIRNTLYSLAGNPLTQNGY